MNNAEIIVIGDEILHGEIRDENGPWLIEQLNHCNVNVVGLHIIPDSVETIVEYFHATRETDYTLVTGGIGPTHDDKTRSALARALDRELTEHEKVKKWLKDHYGDKMNKSRRQLALLPEGAKTIYLPETPAIAFQVDNFFVFPGVPDLLKPLFKKWEHKFTGEECYSYSLSLNAMEGDVAEELENLQKEYSRLQFASYPHSQSITLLVRGYNQEIFERGKEALKKLADNQSIESSK